MTNQTSTEVLDEESRVAAFGFLKQNYVLAFGVCWGKCNTFFIRGFGSLGPKIELLHGSLGSQIATIEASITVKLKIKCINYLHMC